MNGGAVAVHSMKAGLHPFFERGEYVTSDFFAMFGTRFRSGRGWTARQDRDHAQVVVLNAALNRKLFGDASGVGKTVRLNDADFRVIGVLDGFHPQPTFYAQRGMHIFGAADQFFLPLETALDLKFALPGHFSCWGNGGDRRRSDQCTWLQFWVELDSPAKAHAYRRFLADYQADQHAHGRFPAKEPPHLYDLMGWLAHEQIVPANLSMQMWLAIGFLCVCLLSVVALLLAKFLRRAPAISIRRAMGARRRDIFAQCAIESGVIGVLGGLLGLIVAQVGLWAIRQRPDGYAHLAQMDVSMLLGTVGLALVVGVLAGLLPAWRVCQVPPALQLKAQ
jgi:putative ABC transport system permease protein